MKLTNLFYKSLTDQMLHFVKGIVRASSDVKHHIHNSAYYYDPHVNFAWYNLLYDNGMHGVNIFTAKAECFVSCYSNARTFLFEKQFAGQQTRSEVPAPLKLSRAKIAPVASKSQPRWESI